MDTAATRVGDKTAEIASSGKSAIVDIKYKNKVGPHGEIIYVDHSSEYYYINKKDKRDLCFKSQLKG